MAVVTSLTCDLCGTSRNVETLVWRKGKGSSIEAEVCNRCYRASMGRLDAVSRKATNVIRRPRRFKKVEVPEQP